MRNKSYLLFGLLAIFALVISACGTSSTVTDPPPADPTPDMPGDDPAPPEDMSLLDGMSAEELQAAGYVVIAPGETIRIGVSAALTGPIPDPGRDIANGAEVAVDIINEAGGLNGTLFELVIEDGACDGDQGTIVGNLFASDPSIVAVSGGTCSGETFGLTPILQAARIPFVSPSATNPNVTNEDCDICNRVALSDALQGVVDAEFVYNDLGLTTVAVMHDNSDYGLGLAQIFNDHFLSLGGTVTNFEGVQVGDTDFRAVLTTVASNSPELIFFGGYATEAALITLQKNEVGMTDTLFMSDDGAYTQQYLSAAGDAAEGQYMSFVAGDDVADANADFDARYLAKFGVSPDDLGPFHGQSHDTIVVITDAIRRVARFGEGAGAGYVFINREDLIAAIRATSNLQGLTGTLTCNELGDCGAGGVQIFQVQGGAFVQISGFGLD